tara:strand:+ start:192 stop:692 length:501 start_codon:yes stop_codon:yes gene_type:complete
MSSDLKVTNIKHESSSSNNLVLASDGSATIANGTISAGTFNGTIGTSATHGNINLKRTITNNGVFTNGDNDDRHDILTMQDPGFYLVELGYWRSDTTNSSLKGIGQAFVQYIGGNRHTYYSRAEGSSANNIDVANTGTTLQLKYNTNSNGSYTVQFIYIVVASHDI